MSEVDDTVLEKVSIETKAGLPIQAKAEDSDEIPPKPPKRGQSLAARNKNEEETTYARVRKSQKSGFYFRPRFIYKQRNADSETTYMSCLKISVILFNLVICAFGAAIAGIGIWIQTDGDFAKFQENLDVSQFTQAGWILIFVGFIILVIGVIGCFGAICASLCFLIVFTVLVIIVIIMEVVVIALVWTAVSDKNVQEDVKLKAKQAMREMMSNDVKRSFIDLLQSKLKCCGVDGPEDYSLDPYNTMPIPPSCKDTNTGTPYARGCFPTVMEYLESKAALVGGVSVAVVILQCAVIVLVVFLLRTLC